MSSYPLTTQEVALLQQAAGMAGDRLARQENDAGVRSMETLLAHLEQEQPHTISLNVLQREVLGKMLMNLSFDLLREDEDERSALAEELAERLFQDGEGEEV
jgi:arginyl-tRNA synthetase